MGKTSSSQAAEDLHDTLQATVPEATQTKSQHAFFLIHPGVGGVLVFSNLTHALNDGRPVYMLRARGRVCVF